MIRIYDYVIDADRWQYIVGKPTIIRRKDGTVTEEIRDGAYVKGLGDAVAAVYRAKMREIVQGEDMDFKTACDRIHAMDAEFRALVRKAISEASFEEIQLPKCEEVEGEPQ